MFTNIHHKTLQTQPDYFQYDAAIVSHDPGSVRDCGGDAMSMDQIFEMVEKQAYETGLLDFQSVKPENEDVSHAVLAVADESDKELDRDIMISNSQTVPASEPESVQFELPPQDYMHKGQRYKLIFQGVATRCAHCGMLLTDAISQERCLGPICSRRAYSEDQKDSDEIQAMIDLAEYPLLVEFLTNNYKPMGVRALINGLVKICALNRRSPVHQACCDAIESLGYAKLASVLRESLAVIEIKDHDEQTYNVWIKRSEYQYAWASELRQRVPNSYMSRQYKGLMIPKAAKSILWDMLIKYYSGMMAKVPDGCGGKKAVKIFRKKS